MHHLQKLFGVVQALGLVSLVLTTPVPDDNRPALRHIPKKSGSNAARDGSLHHGSTSPRYQAENNTVYGPDGQALLDLQDQGWANLQDDLDELDIDNEYDEDEEVCTSDNVVMHKEW